MKKTLVTVAAVALGLAAFVTTERGAGSAKTRLAIAIGLNSVDPAAYTDGEGKPWSGELRGCENDADAMLAIAHAQGYETIALKTAAATRPAVRDALKAAAQKLKAGDTLVLSYSGHGGQVRDTNGDEADGLDETWCLYDGEMVDDELAVCWSKFQPDVRIVVYSDSCHSGSVIKTYEANAEAKGTAPTERFRIMPDRVAEKLRALPAHQDLDKGMASERTSRGQTKASVILISGCQDDQLSGDGDQNGWFTEHLLKVWNNAAFRGSYWDFYQAIRKTMPSSQKPNFDRTGKQSSAFEAERPWLSR